jgi:hypothetical protein
MKGISMKRTVFAILSVLLLAGCGKPAEHLAWKQEVPLHDGRVIVLDRLSFIGAEAVLMNRLRMEIEQTLAFTHPDTGERIEWKLPEGLIPHMLDVDGGVPYYVLEAHTVGDYNTWNCPNPPWMVFRYVGARWQRTPVEDLPPSFVDANLLAMAKDEERHIVNGYVTRDALRMAIRSWDPDRRVINRQKINPIAEGCHNDILVKLGRQSESDYGR